jgi:hypothetical protein
MKTQIANSHLISVPPRPGASALHAALVDLDGCHDEEIQVIARGLTFATPRELCGLRAVVERAAVVAERVHLDCPANDHLHRYLERMDLYRDLPDNVTLSRRRPRLRRRVRDGELVELVSISTLEDVDLLDTRVAKVAEGQVGPGSVARALVTAVAAAAENAVHHAASPFGALVAAQSYKRTGLELAVVDIGDGIPATLARNPKFAGLSDIQAVERALEDHVSCVREPGRGAGLWEFVRDVSRGGNATLGIASGHADLRISWSDGAETRNATTARQPVPGTWIWVRLEASKGENR